MKTLAVGDRVGYLTLVERSPSRPGRKAFWLALCVCGTKKLVRSDHLRSAATKSCGCKTAEMCAVVHLRHGDSARGQTTTEYTAWARMRARCDNPNTKQFKDWGGRGITICERWRGEHGFENFLADVGRRPSPSHSIERIDNDGNYEPGNCRWATRGEQALNKRSNRVLTVGGVALPLAEWSRRTGISGATIGQRLRKGWTQRRAVTEPCHTEKRNRRVLKFAS